MAAEMAPAMVIGFGPCGPTARLARSAKLVAKSPSSERGRALDGDVGHGHRRQIAVGLRAGHGGADQLGELIANQRRRPAHEWKNPFKAV